MAESKSDWLKPYFHRTVKVGCCLEQLYSEGIVLRTLLHVIFPLLVGTSIYTLWRSRQLLVFRWYEVVRLSGVVAFVRHAAHPFRRIIPPIVLYSIPDALWVYSFTAALALLWRNDSNSLPRAGWLLLPSALGLAGEFGQAVHLVPGTFDFSDVLCYLVGGVLGSVLPNISLTRIGLTTARCPYDVS